MVSMSPATTCRHTPSGWADLPPDLLGDVSDRLHDDAADIVRLHAVCTSWRDALVAVTTSTIKVSRPPFRPHLITPCEGRLLRTAFSFGRVSAGTTTRTSSCYGEGCNDGIRFADDDGGGCTSWVASADGTAAWTFTHATLVNLLTEGVTRLPSFREYDLHQRMHNSHGIVYGDNTVFLYNIAYRLDGHPTLSAAILHPGDPTWTCVRFPTFVKGPLAAAYRKGKIILLCTGVHYWCAVTSPHNGGVGGGDLELEPRWGKFAYVNHMHNYSHVLMFGDELLWVSVVVHRDSWWPDDNNNVGDHIAHVLSLTVHALVEEDADGNGDNVKMRWATKDGRIIFADHVLFLGFPASFAVDARQLDMHGGCAYFVIRRCVFNYSFTEDKATLVKRLCPIWHNGMTCSWLWPQPTIAPIQDIRKRLEAPNTKKQKVCKI